MCLLGWGTGTRTAMRFWLFALSWRSFCGRTFTGALAIALLLATSCQSQAGDPEPKRVMILHSVGREFRPWNTYAKDIRAELDRQSRWPVDVQEHSLVSARSADPRADALFLDYIRA